MLSSRLKHLRKMNNFTQEEIAKRLGMARTTYSGYESGARDPDPETLKKIADYYGVSVDYLLGRDDSRQYGAFFKALKEKYPGVNIDDPDIQRKLMRLVDLVLEDYQKNQQ